MKKPKPIHLLHISRLLLFSILAVALLIGRGESGSALRLTYDKNVLAYASNMTIADLLTATNASRAANGLSPLSLDNTLNTSAQLKANDMVEKNYWSHVSPDGTQPWYWFEQAGYTYASAGENLAYGFSTGAEVETAWMNSAEHKANVLGNYDNVGFGISNSTNFQGGENTVVVAHYGKPRVVAAEPVTSGSAGALSSTTGTQAEKVTTTLELLEQGQTPVFAAAGLGLVAVVAGGFGLAHRAYLKHALREGKHFAAHHPLIDVAAVGSVIGLILTATAGHLL